MVDYSDQISALHDRMLDLLQEANLNTDAASEEQAQAFASSSSGNNVAGQASSTLNEETQQHIIKCLERGEIPEEALSELIHSADAQTAKDIHTAMDEFEFDKIIAIIKTLS